jgi:hypothetical protein
MVRRHLREGPVPRYIIERTFPDGLRIPMNSEGTAICGKVGKNNSLHGVSWLHSYVSEDGKKTFCVYDGPDPESIRKVAELNGLPVDRIHQVTVLDPYFYTP